jgi:hypothetical protein
MRYDDAKVKVNGAKNWNNSGNESLGFESFDRDDLCMCTNAISASADNTSWGWCAQGTNSRIEPCSTTATLSWCDAKADNIATLDSSISALSCNASSMNSEIDKLNKQLKMLAAKIGVGLDMGANDKLDLKNQFRGGRLRRCQLQTL